MLTNPAHDKIRTALRDFAVWRHQHLSGDEKGEAQNYLDRLFRAFGHQGIREAGATLEARIKSKDRRGTAFADLMWKPRVLIEMKKSGSDLKLHYRQAFDYWVQAVPDRPRFVVLCNFDEFWVYDFDSQMDEPVDRVSINDLSDRWESLAFLLPIEQKPIFSNDLVAVTREAARDVTKVLNSMVNRGVDRDDAQRFVLQCVMAMFSEDVGLLPTHLYTQAIHDANSGAEAFDLIGQLFAQMNTPGITPGGRYKGIPYFNGGIFELVHPIEVSMSELAMLREAASTNWAEVRPEIFGTLFEGSMGKTERHSSGAHYTSQADIAMIVGPVIVEPWRARIEGASRIADLERVLADMQAFRVLDPACGSGNFLYVAYREMRRLESEAIEKMRSLSRGGNVAASFAAFSHVQPDHFMGIDTNKFAVEIAKITLLLAKKLAADELRDEDDTAVLPLDNLDESIIVGDALFVSWPRADAIVGNPPFLGRRKMVEELGAVYSSRLASRYPNVSGVSDFVCYWFPLAHDALPFGGRAGLVGTKTIKQGSSRKSSLDYIVDNGGEIIEAVSHKAWSGEANVTVSIVNWQKGGAMPALRVLWVENGNERLELDAITSSLAPRVDLRKAQRVSGAKKVVFQGQTPGITEAFKIDGPEARRLVKANPTESEVIRPFLGGDELLKRTSVEDWIIDIPEKSVDDVQSRYPGIFARLEKLALPPRSEAARLESDRNLEVALTNPGGRTNRHHSNFLDRWWQLGYRREDMLNSLQGLDRYIGLTRVSSEERGPVFCFIDSKIVVGDSAVAFPFGDEYSLGILQSSAHVLWFRERCSTLETRLRYTSNTVSDTFPWPQSPTAASVKRVSLAAAEINRYREEYFRMGRSLAQMYDTLRSPGHSVLRGLHDELDSAVMNCYRFDSTDVLSQLFELNLVVATHVKNGVPITLPGPQGDPAALSSWRFPAPTL